MMQKVLHETCLEYLRRRLSEGWKCISLDGYNAVLLSPWGQRRELDLRNDVETLRPNEAGDETNIEFQYPGTGEHWDKVDEVEADGNATRVYSETADWRRDLYNLPASSGSGTINSVKVYATVWGYAGNRYAKVALKAGETVDEGDSVAMDETWKLISKEWTTNPDDSEAWEWPDIDALQIGVALWGVGSGGINECRCTQVMLRLIIHQ